MLREFLETLCLELDLPPPPKEGAPLSFELIPELKISFQDLKPGVAFSSLLSPCPEKRREELFTFLMRANLLGQGTGGSRIGLTADETHLTLSLGLPYELKPPDLRSKLEDFVNYVTYWREEIDKFEKEEPLV